MRLIKLHGPANLLNVLLDNDYSRPVSGDNHWTHRHPDWIGHRGDNHYLRKNPELRAAISGDRHWTRQHPEDVLRGEKHPWNKNPELRQHCIDAMQAALATDPLKRPRGERHGMSKLTEEQVDEIRKRYTNSREPGQSPITGENLAEQFGVTAAQISRILKGGWSRSNLIERHGNAKLTADQTADIKEKRAVGRSYQSIAADYGVTTNAVFCICNGYKPKRKAAAGRRGNAKLTADQVTELCQHYRTGDVTQSSLAKMFGISLSQVIRLIKQHGAHHSERTRNFAVRKPRDKDSGEV